MHGILKRSDPTSEEPSPSDDDDTKAESNADRGVEGAGGSARGREWVRAAAVEGERRGVCPDGGVWVAWDAPGRDRAVESAGRCAGGTDQPAGAGAAGHARGGDVSPAGAGGRGQPADRERASRSAAAASVHRGEVQDSTTVRLPDDRAVEWPGCGASKASDDASARLKLQVRLGLTRGELAGPEPPAGRASDRATVSVGAAQPGGALFIADLGDVSLPHLAALGAVGVDGLSRLHVQTAVFAAEGQRLALRDWLRQHATTPATTSDQPVTLGGDQHLPARLLAVRLPPEVSATRRRKLKAEAQRRGKTVSQARLARADWLGPTGSGRRDDPGHHRPPTPAGHRGRPHPRPRTVADRVAVQALEEAWTPARLPEPEALASGLRERRQAPHRAHPPLALPGQLLALFQPQPRPRRSVGPPVRRCACHRLRLRPPSRLHHPTTRRWPRRRGLHRRSTPRSRRLATPPRRR